MTTLELFRKHRKGEVSRERFLYEVRRDSNLPWVTNTTSYTDAVKILKNKGIIREAQFEPQNITTDPAVDRVNPYALKREVEKLLSKEKVLTNDSYKEALNKAAKKLANPQAVKAAMFANADSVAKADANLQTQEVKKANHVDKKNGMKKMKGQQMPKATSASTKENKKTKKPKGVQIMPDKGVEGSEKVIKESVISELTSYLKKKLNLSEHNPYNIFHQGMAVETAEGPGVVQNVMGGTLEVKLSNGRIVHEQMNTVQKRTEAKKEQPQHQEEIGAKQQYESGFEQLEEATFDTKEEAEEWARKESENGYVQHVQDKGGHFTVDDWYDSDETIASYENGNLLENESGFVVAEEANSYNLDQTISDIKSNLATSSALKIELRMNALQELENVEEFIKEENWEEALMSLEDITVSIKEANPIEYEEVYAEDLNNIINQVDGLYSEMDSYDWDAYEDDEDLEEAGEKTAIVTTTSGEKTAIDYKTDDELKSIGDNADIKSLKTGTGKKVKE
jgi:hypothetical protein